MTLHVLALDSFVTSALGPVLTRDLRPGVQLAAIVGGMVEPVSVESVRSGAEIPAYRLLTRVGDIVLPADADVLVRGGVHPVAKLAASLLEQARPRLEISPPTLSTRPSHTDSPSRLALRAALTCLATDGVVQVPAPAALELGLKRELEQLLKSAGVGAGVIEDERWLVFVLEDLDSEAATFTERLAEQALALHRLMAWEERDGDLVSRVPLKACEARRRLLAGLAATGQPFDVEWQPGYHPVECRVRQIHREWPPFVPVVGALVEEGTRTLTVETSRPCSVVVGMAVVGAMV